MNNDSAMKGRTAVVAGATGYLGRHVVRTLHRHGWRVRALARNPERLAEARTSCDEVFVAEATRSETLRGLFDGADVAFSSIGVRHFRRRPTYEEVDFGANINLVDAAVEAGVRRFVFVSVFDGGRIRRLSPLVDARERVVDKLRRTGMETVILRPTGFFNDMGDFFQMARRGKCWLIGTGETKINPIHGADLAEVAFRAMAETDPASEYPAGGPEVFSQQEIAELAFSVLNKPPRFGRIRPGIIRFLAYAIKPFNKNASALALMFSALGEFDGVAPRYGDQRLASFFRHLAEQD